MSNKVKKMVFWGFIGWLALTIVLPLLGLVLIGGLIALGILPPEANQFMRDNALWFGLGGVVLGVGTMMPGLLKKRRERAESKSE